MKIVEVVSHAPYVSSYIVESAGAPRMRPGMVFKAKDGAVFYLQEVRLSSATQLEVGFAPAGGAGTRELAVGDELEVV